MSLRRRTAADGGRRTTPRLRGLSPDCPPTAPRVAWVYLPAATDRSVTPVGLADDFERRLEQVVEGFFSKAFRSRLQPAEIGRRLLREMEGGKVVSVGEVYVPNRYIVMLAPADHGRLKGLFSELVPKFSGLLAEAARDRRWALPGPLTVAFEQDEGVKEGRFEVHSHHEAQDAPRGAPAPPQIRTLQGDSPVTWPLGSSEVLIGRQDSCDIVVPDPDTSRRHARISRRDDGWWISDLESTNGTFVNGKVIKERRLVSGDRIRIGGTEFEFDETPSGTGG